MVKVLIVDDDVAILKSLEMTLKINGIESISTNRGNMALKLIDPTVNLVLLDVNLGHFSGKDILNSIKENHPLLPVIMISGLSTMEDAVEAIKDGAFDFIQKPLNPDRLLVSIDNALKFSKLRDSGVNKPIACSDAMKRVITICNRVSATNSTVLITGESGVGKDVIANYIHSISNRGINKIVGINCGAIPETIIESELFGFKKGSFTGSVSDSKGKIFNADKSSLFLDEIGELPLSSQVKLLRFIENGEIQRIGEDFPVKVDARLIVATNRDLMELVKEGSFREDLLYRLNVINIHIPPLRERKDEIKELVEKFSRDISSSMEISYVTFSNEAISYLESYNFPGNIRELKNIVERAIIFCNDSVVTKDDIIFDNRGDGDDDIFSLTMPLSKAKKLLESKYIVKQLKKHNNSIKETAVALEILPNNLSRRIRDLGIKSDML